MSNTLFTYKYFKNQRQIGVVISVISAVTAFFGLVSNVHAGFIFNAPKYIGLTNGLVGYWSFDGLNTLSTALDTLFAFAIMALLTPPALSSDCAGFCL